MQKPGRTTPWIFLTGIAAVLVILATTDILVPIMQFIHTDQVNTWQIIACIVFSILGLWLTFFLLNILCNFYVSRLNQVPGNSTGILSSHSTDHGGEMHYTGQRK